MAIETLRWPKTEHALFLDQGPTGVKATLQVVKPAFTQHIQIALPDSVSVAMIKQAWDEQQRNWATLDTKGDSRVYMATRAIWLPGVGSILWYVFHLKDAPYDACVFSSLTREVWNATL